MAASQLRLVLEGQRLPRGSVYQPPSKLGAGGPPQVLVALSCSSCCRCYRATHQMIKVCDCLKELPRQLVTQSLSELR